jgi:hypothetical protein
MGQTHSPSAADIRRNTPRPALVNYEIRKGHGGQVASDPQPDKLQSDFFVIKEINFR